MAIFQSDLTIKTAIQLGIDDMRKNEWLIDDMLSDCVQNPYLQTKYGQKQIDACKEWLTNNQIDIYMAERKDKDRFPCITITLGSSSEKDEMKTMADQSTETIKLLPNQIGKPIPYVVKPFTGFTYSPMNGEVTFPANTKNIDGIATGMILVDPATGNGYVIQDVTSNGVVIEESLTINATKLAVLPQNQFYEARVEHTFFQETYNIGCHSHGDPQALLWLHSIVLYSILRYRESLLEANGFGQCNLSSSDLMTTGAISSEAGDTIYVRYITLTGMVENSWIKSPRRIIEKLAIRDVAGQTTVDGTVLPGPDRNAGFVGGIKILSNLDTPDIIDESDNLWNTIDDGGDETAE
jgi:hypothetical protein